MIPEIPVQINKEEPKSNKITNENAVDKLIHYTFYITFVFLTTTATITFIEAIRTNDPFVRHIFNLETCISIIASFFYYQFISRIEEYKKTNTPIDWCEFSLLRYTDWSITTPFMLSSLIFFLSYNVKIPVTLSVIVSVLILNYIMLIIGFLGEIGNLDKWTACIGGFIPFITMIFIIYINYIYPKYNMANTVLFSVYFIIWSFYGIVYMFSEKYKNIAMNFLDLCAKCLVGIGMWFYIINIIRFK